MIRFGLIGLGNIGNIGKVHVSNFAVGKVRGGQPGKAKAAVDLVKSYS